MTWLSVVAVIVKLLGPLLIAWLEELLDDAAESMTNAPDRSALVFPLDLEAFFTVARKQVWWFQFRKRAALRLLERVCTVRADEVRLAAMYHGSPLLPLTFDERISLKAALGA